MKINDRFYFLKAYEGIFLLPLISLLYYYNKMKKLLYLLLVIGVACSGEKSVDSGEESANTPPGKIEMSAEEAKASKGIGPVKSVDISDEIDQEMAATGKDLFSSKCSACHQLTADATGPALAGILDRRSPEWTMNMILNPTEMVAEDPVAKKVYEDWGMSPMVQMVFEESEARAILEYIRSAE